MPVFDVVTKFNRDENDKAATCAVGGMALGLLQARASSPSELIESTWKTYLICLRPKGQVASGNGMDDVYLVDGLVSGAHLTTQANQRVYPQPSTQKKD